MNIRITLTTLFLTGCWTAVLLRAIYLQAFPQPRLDKLRREKFEMTLSVPANRGTIYDSQGQELAVSVAAYSLFADPSAMTHSAGVARKLAQILQIPARELKARLRQKNRKFIWIKRRLSLATRQQIEKLNFRSLHFIEEGRRVYPNGALLSQVLGFVGSDGFGLEGLEKQFDTQLAGEPQKLRISKDAFGRPLLREGQLITPKNKNGSDLYLTIQREIQFFLESELSQTIDQFKAQSAVGVVLDADTSEVLALANIPTFEPHRPMLGKSSQVWRNRAITDAFEPGSTMKSITVAAALKHELASASTQYYCENGKFQIGGRVINEAERDHIFGWLSVSEILNRSSNIGASKIGLSLGAKKLRQTLTDFGFGEKTGVEFPGETKGILQSLPWSPHLLSTISFGQGISATPLQIANAYASIANGGIWRQPKLIKEIVAPLSSSEPAHPPPSTPSPGQRILSIQQARKLQLMLTSATAPDATGHLARIEGFPVAGKTGTAQKVNPVAKGYLKNTYISSFAGFAPAQQPRYVIYIAIDSPQKSYYGSQVAAPVFSRVAQFLLQQGGLTPTLLTEKNLVDPGLEWMKTFNLDSEM